MNYLGLISICLGIISVLIAVYCMNYSEHIYSELKNIRLKIVPKNKNLEIKNKNKICKLLIELESESGLSLDNLKKNILSYKKGLRENFNSPKYISSKDRGFDFQTNSKFLDYSKISQLSGVMGKYEELFTMTFNRIKQMDKKDKNSLLHNINKLFLENKIDKPSKTSTDSKSAIPNPPSNGSWCHVKYNKNNYCFKVPIKKLCVNGKIKTTNNDCDFY